MIGIIFLFSCEKIEDTPTLPLEFTVSITNVSIFGGSDGKIVINVTSGVPPYSYKIGSSNQSSNEFCNLVSGIYTITVTDSKQQVLSNNVTITEPPETPKVTVIKKDITCKGSNNGIIHIYPVESFQYSINGGNWGQLNTFNNLAPGIYNIKVKDGSSNIVFNENISIIEPNIVNAIITSTNITCFGANDGTIIISSPTGGYGTYQYSIDGGTNWSSTTQFYNLTPNTYNVWIRDASIPNYTCISGCQDIVFPNENPPTYCQLILGSINITQPQVLNAVVTSSIITNVGDNNGIINILSASGGSGVYEYSINGGTTWKTSGYFNNLVPGKYDVYLKDAVTGCVKILNSCVIKEPTYVKNLIDFTLASYNKETISTEVSAYVNTINGTNKFSISFWYNTPTSTLNKNNPTWTSARLLSSDHTSNPSNEATTWIEINNTDYQNTDPDDPIKAKIEYGRIKANPLTTDKITLNSRTVWSGLHHIVVIFDGFKIKMYIDNVLINEVSSSISLNINKIYFGGHESNTNYEYNGIISKIKIYNDAITPVEVDYLFKN